ncbi:hypothetical protein FOH10_02315 [Nocardia otitidiscaviarum]|uniref:Uncharacterized protein n=1 Tax=Nocardia otitidiscaviarum TaxID=1823 RepID=A0A516NFR8_9NOCA|nr:DUF6401 family natural product biosynthesis protein [Nocardia otitidiscaviarum]MCP9623089.1 DUF6401 family natural product biosynthesis protein [Nocardia otitidiscaviarum]QDP77754.1 hypothetical protein FOH10_02315 [Nocardia otitidiscaviarum]
MFLLGSALLEVSARKTLKSLHRTHGAPATLAASAYPAVSALVDQHAAAVRDIIDLGVENSGNVPVSVLLAGYARGLLDNFRELGGAPAAPHDWISADWLHLRLAGVCQLAHSA